MKFLKYMKEIIAMMQPQYTLRYLLFLSKKVLIFIYFA